MPPKAVLQVVAACVVAALAASSAVRGHAPESLPEWLSPLGPGVAVAGAGLWLFDRYAWRWAGICKVVGRPVLHGTWYGELASHWVNPETNHRVPVDPDVFLVVRQRYWHITVRLLTKESSSVSMLANLEKGTDGVHQLFYVYANTPRPDVRHRSALHYGAVVIGAPRDRSQGLQGEYFTGRNTQGEMRFRRSFPCCIETHAGGLEVVAAADRRVPTRT